MIRFRAFGLRFSMPPLAFIMPLLARRLGLRGAFLPMLLALSIHEGAHFLAARLCRVRIAELRILPFGGSARIENPYGISRRQLFYVAAAGPCANLLLLLTLQLCACLGMRRAQNAAALFQTNLVLLLFNLLPALPLDGGRMLYSLLSKYVSQRAALEVGLWLGRIVAALLLAAMIYGGLRRGVWNLSFAFGAIFMLASERDEREALLLAKIRKHALQIERQRMQASAV